MAEFRIDLDAEGSQGGRLMPRPWLCEPVIGRLSPWSDEAWEVWAEDAGAAARHMLASAEFQEFWGDEPPPSEVRVAAMRTFAAGTVSRIMPDRKYQAAAYEELWDLGLSQTYRVSGEPASEWAGAGPRRGGVPVMPVSDTARLILDAAERCGIGGFQFWESGYGMDRYLDLLFDEACRVRGSELGRFLACIGDATSVEVSAQGGCLRISIITG